MIYQRNKGVICSNCGVDPAHATGRCRRCYRYFLEHGTERPWTVRMLYGLRHLRGA